MLSFIQHKLRYASSVAYLNMNYRYIDRGIAMTERNLMPIGTRTPTVERIKNSVISIVVITIVGAFAFWSGVPAGERALSFWIGVIVLFAMLGAFGLATWHLLFRPVPAGQAVAEQPIMAAHRQALALLLGMGGVSIIVGTFWDEVWHRQYGIPFGEDFFWRPHLLMYFGFLAAIGLAFAGLYIIGRRGRGNIQQRFRANPVIGLLILIGALLTYVLPADPIWHAIYGEDLTAWSVPHLVLIASFVLILLLAAAIHMSAQPRREWASLRRLRLVDMLPLLMFATTSLMWNQFFIVEWDAGADFVLNRPEWLLPVLIVSGAAFIGVMANHALRTYGAATLSGLLALILRFALIQLFGVEKMMFVNAWLLALPSMILIDLWYAYRPGARFGAGGAPAVGMVVMLLTSYQQFYPLYFVTNLPVAFGMVLIVSLAASLVGAALGDYFAEGNKQAGEAAGSRAALMSLGVVGATLIFVVVFVATATPPG